LFIDDSSWITGWLGLRHSLICLLPASAGSAAAGCGGLRPGSACDQPVKLPEIVTAPTWHSGVSQGFRGRGRGFLHVQTVSSFRRHPTRNGSRVPGRRDEAPGPLLALLRVPGGQPVSGAGRDSRICSASLQARQMEHAWQFPAAAAFRTQPSGCRLQGRISSEAGAWGLANFRPG